MLYLGCSCFYLFHQILIYEKYVSDLHDIIYELLLQLNCKDRKASALDHSSEKSVTQTSATIGVDLKKENPEDTAIAAMDLTE